MSSRSRQRPRPRRTPWRQAEAAALRAEAAHSAARQALDVARGPLAEADRRVGRLEAEAKALAKLIDVEAKKLWPPAIDLLTVEKGFEAALGAALGDDLEAPVDPASPIRWAGATADGDPALPEGAEPLARHVTAPPELARRLAQIGVVDRALGRDAGRAVASPASGWSRPKATCGAGTALRPPRMRRPRRRAGSRRRTASPISTRSLTHARTDAEASAARSKPPKPNSTAAVAAEGEARNARREAQAQADAARDAHAAAEREANRLTARLSALAEAKVRLAASRDETLAAKRDAAQAIEALGSAADLENQLAESRGEVAAKRAVLAEARGEAQALAREAELRAKRRIAAIAAGARRMGWTARRARPARSPRSESASTDAQAERSSLEGAPAAFAEQRRALISEIEAGRSRAARSLRPARRRRDRARRGRQGGARRARGDGRSAHRAGARRGTARGREPPHHRRRARNPRDARNRARATSRRLPRSRRATRLPDVAAVEERLDKLRRDRERLGAVNLRAEEELTRGRGAAHQPRHRARRSHRGDQAAAPGHPEPQPRGARAAVVILRRW